MSMAGPYCTMVLGDLGAEVIKIESFPDGDSLASLRSPGQRRVVLLRRAEPQQEERRPGREAPAREGSAAEARALRRTSCSRTSGRAWCKKLGIDYEAICRVKPDVIYASMSGFGQTGPYGKKGGFDIIAQGMSGIMMMTG